MSTDGEQVKANITDPDLVEVVRSLKESKGSKAAVVREGIASLAQETHDLPDDLSEDQRQAYRWLLDRTDGGGSTVALEAAESKLAQLTGIGQGPPLRNAVLSPLDAEGYISVVPRQNSVRVSVHPPEAVRA